MSSIKLKHASGNSMSLAAPATNPASDLELKLPAAIGSANHILKNSGTAGTLEFANSVNTPIVFAWNNQGGTEGLTDATWTKNTWLTSEEIDTDGAFSASRFTVPADKGGVYFIAIGNNLYGDSNNIRAAMSAIYKNGSGYAKAYNTIFSTSSSGLRHFQAERQLVTTLAAGDYIESYMYCDVESGPLYFSSDSSGVRGNYLMAFRLSY